MHSEVTRETARFIKFVFACLFILGFSLGLVIGLLV